MCELRSLWNYCLLRNKKRWKREKGEEIKELSWGPLIPPIYLHEGKTLTGRTEHIWSHVAHSTVPVSGMEGQVAPFHQHRRNLLRDLQETMRSSTCSRLLDCPLFCGEISTPERGFPRSGTEGKFNGMKLFVLSSRTTLLPSALWRDCAGRLLCIFLFIAKHEQR